MDATNPPAGSQGSRRTDVELRPKLLPLPPLSMDTASKTIFRVVRGNVIGVIEEPVPVPDGVRPPECWMVKVGLIDDEKARREPFPQGDVDAVTCRLYAFLTGD